eukprot:9330882-Alexandrium_andersonii.AAC.1
MEVDGEQAVGAEWCPIRARVGSARTYLCSQTVAGNMYSMLPYRARPQVLPTSTCPTSPSARSSKAGPDQDHIDVAVIACALNLNVSGLCALGHCQSKQ